MSNTWIQMFDSEYEAFATYCREYPDNCVLLIDTYDTMDKGLPDAIKAFDEVLAPMGKRPKGVRINSGDLAYLSKKIRRVLNESGYPDCDIYASNSLDEYIIRDMLQNGARIDSFLVGERLITSASNPVMNGVYKLSAIEKDGQKVAIDELTYAEDEIRRIGRIGFETAQKRGKRLCSVEKSNVLDSSRLWKKVMHELASEYPDVELSDMLVDNCAMQIVKDPSQFDVVVTENMFGDILSDEASMITGSIGMIPSSSLGASTCGLYEPIHGSAPDIAGQDIANPIGTILSAAMMLRYSFDLAAEADAIEAAVSRVLDAGYRTGDIFSPGCTKVGCTEMGKLILEQI